MPPEVGYPEGNETELHALSARVDELRTRIGNAARRAGRLTAEITLVGVSKHHTPQSVVDAARAGICTFGENYVQEALPKMAAVAQRLGVSLPIDWHLIGPLQSNKARRAIDAFALIQSVDRDSLAQEISRQAEKRGCVQSVLVEVNLDGSPNRAGAAIEAALPLCERVAATPGIALKGLMGIAPLTHEPAGARPHFATLRGLFERLPNAHRHVLSMGMSHDFEVAIEEGATMVRIGTALFGPRPHTRVLGRETI